MLVVGDREVEEGTVAVRTREGKNMGSMELDAFVGHLKSEVDRRGKTGN
jgi:threonyl-tRNA synthetase